MVNRYYVFIHPVSYRLGGMDDCKGVFNTAGKAIDFAKNEKWYQDEVVVWDVVKNKKAWSCFD